MRAQQSVLHHDAGWAKFDTSGFSQLWLQQRVASEDLKIEKVKGTENVADALTKHLGVEDTKMHMDGVGLEHRSGRHNLMPEVAKDGDDEKYIVMGTAEREEDEDEYLAVISGVG